MYAAQQRVPCYDVASVRQRDGALRATYLPPGRHDTLTSDTGHVPEGPCVTRLLAAVWMQLCYLV